MSLIFKESQYFGFKQLFFSFTDDTHKATNIAINDAIGQRWPRNTFGIALQSLKHFLLNNLKGDKSL